jgi:hypothetical protein
MMFIPIFKETGNNTLEDDCLLGCGAMVLMMEAVAD